MMNKNDVGQFDLANECDSAIEENSIMDIDNWRYIYAEGVGLNNDMDDIEYHMQKYCSKKYYFDQDFSSDQSEDVDSFYTSGDQSDDISLYTSSDDVSNQEEKKENCESQEKNDADRGGQVTESEKAMPILSFNYVTDFNGNNFFSKFNDRSMMQEYQYDFKFIPPRNVEMIYELRNVNSIAGSVWNNQLTRFVDIIDNITLSKQSYYENIIRNVEKLAKSLWPNVNVETYGSYATDLMIPSSDIDFVITLPCNNNKGNAMREFFKALKSQSWVNTSSMQCIETANIPVIKLKSDTNFPIDITFYNNKHYGTKARDLVNNYVKEFKELRPLALFLKEFLSQRLLNNPYKGGLGSFCLVLMIVAFLKIYKKKSDNLGTLLSQFLELYGRKFDYDKITINVNQNCFNEIPENITAAPLHITDPFNYGVNIAWSTFEMWKVKCNFSEAYDQLHNNNLIENIIKNSNV